MSLAILNQKLMYALTFGSGSNTGRLAKDRILREVCIYLPVFVSVIVCVCVFVSVKGVMCVFLFQLHFFCSAIQLNVFVISAL